MTKEAFVLNVNELSAKTFNALIGDMHEGVQVEHVEIKNRAACGDGVASTADRINLELAYRENTPALPQQLVFKTLLLNPLLRLGLPAILSLSSSVRFLENLPLIGGVAARFLFVLVGVFQKYFPQAPDAMYQVESRFYHDIRPQLDIEAPAVFAARYDDKSRHFAVLMEDLTLRGASFPNALQSLDIATVKSTLFEMAKLHARYWQSAELEQELSWVPTRMAGGMFPVFDGIGFDLIRYQVEQNQFKADLLVPLNKSVDELWAGMWQTQALLTKGPQTLLHGDTHLGNTYVLPNGQGGLIDFQLLVKGNYCIDVCYYIITALNPEQRREHEQALYHFYLQSLRDLGVGNVPSFAEAWQDHRLASLWGLVIGWLITPPVNYGEAVTAANIERMSLAVADYQPFALLEQNTWLRDTHYSDANHSDVKSSDANSEVGNGLV